MEKVGEGKKEKSGKVRGKKVFCSGEFTASDSPRAKGGKVRLDALECDFYLL